MVVHQASLFPDGAELWGRALDALEDMDVAQARRHVRGTDALAAERAETAEIEAVVDWLEACSLGPDAPLDHAVRAFRETPRAVRLGLLAPGAARRADKALARFLLRRAEPHAACVGAEEPLPAGRLQLALGQRGRALRSLRVALEQGGHDLADLWYALGDVYHLEGDEGDAAAYARALALDPAGIEPFRLAHPGLAALLEALEARHDPQLARQRMLVEGWLAGLLQVPERDPWYAARAERFSAECASLEPTSAEARARLFTLHFIADRSDAPRSADAERRLAMHELDGPLLERMVAALRARERAAPRLPLR